MNKFQTWCALMTLIAISTDFAACAHTQREPFAQPAPNLVEQTRLAINTILVNNTSAQTTLTTLRNSWQQAETTLAQQLPNYGNELLTCSADMVKTITHLASVEVAYAQANNPSAGLSGNALVIARSNGKPIAFIKAFAAGHTGFAKEFWAQSNLLQQEISVPQIIGIGMCKSQKESYFLLASKFVSGTLVNDALIALLNQKNNSLQRAQQLQRVSTIYNNLGNFLGKLHTKKQLHNTGNDIAFQLHQNTLNKVFEIYSASPPSSKLSLDNLKTLAKKFTDNRNTQSIMSTYSHRDAHPGNHIVDELTNTVYMLDLEDTALSIGPNATPLGNAFDDYAKIIDSLHVRMSFGLSCEEFTTIKNAFDRAYANTGATLPSLEQSDYYSFVEIMEYFAWYLPKRDSFPAYAKDALKTMFDTGTTWLKRSLVSESINKDYCL